LASISGRRVAVCAVGLQGLAALAAAHGQSSADAARAALEAALRRVVRREDAVTLQGRDTLLVVVPDLQHPAHAEAVAEKIAATAASFVQAPTRGLDVHVGLAIYPNHGDSVSALLAAADASQSRARTAALGGEEPFRWGTVRRPQVA
jgi:GGDEF domain-containing protein